METDEDDEERFQRDLQIAMTISMVHHRTHNRQLSASDEDEEDDDQLNPLLKAEPSSSHDAEEIEELRGGGNEDEEWRVRSCTVSIPRVEDIMAAYSHMDSDSHSSTHHGSLKRHRVRDTVESDSDVCSQTKRSRVSVSRRSSVCSNSSRGSTGDSKHIDFHGLNHLTRQQSREWSRLLYGGPRDPGSIRHELDPNIFDAEISEHSSSESELELLPEVKMQLQEILEPQSLDLSYDESAEPTDDDLLPDLDGPPRPRHRPVRPRAVTPVLDKLAMVPQVRGRDPNVVLTRLEEEYLRINKKLKLRSVSPSVSDTLLSSLDSSGLENRSDVDHPGIENHSGLENSDPLSEPCTSGGTMWNKQHNNLLRSIVSRVCASRAEVQDLSLSRNDDSFSRVSNNEELDTTLSYGDTDTDFHVSVASERTPKPWVYDSSSSELTDIDSDEEERRAQLRQEAGETHTGLGRVVCHLNPTTKPRPSPTTPCPRRLLRMEPGVHAISTDSDIEPQPLDYLLEELIRSSDIDDVEFQLRYLRLVRGCVCDSVRWPDVILQQLLDLLMAATDIQVTWGAYDLLQQVLGSGTAKLPFQWPHIESVIQRLKLNHGLTNTYPHQLLGPTLALQYMVCGMESDLCRTAGRVCDGVPSYKHLVKSRAYQWLSLDRGAHNAKQVICWLVAAVSYGQHCPHSFTTPSLQLQPIREQHRGQGGGASGRELPRILSLLQRLVNLAVVVSRRRENNIDHLVTELVRGYVHLPMYYHRHLLLSSIQPRLLTYRVCEQILQDYSVTGNSGEQASSPGSLYQLLDHYGWYEPPTLTLTPPLTPTHHESPSRQETYSGCSVEELAFILYSLVDSFIHVAPGKDNESSDKITQQLIDIQSRYESFTTELTGKTQLYLTMVEALIYSGRPSKS